MTVQRPWSRLPLLLLAALAIAASSAPQHLFLLVDSGRYGFVDVAGRTAIAPRFESARTFREGLAPVQHDDRWGYIDTAGELVIPYQFDDALPFSEGRAVIAAGVERERRHGFIVTTDFGRLGFIDRSGAVVIPALYDAADHFSEGLAAVVTGKTIRYLDLQGNTAFELQLPDSDEYTDRRGASGVEPERRFSEGLAAFAVPAGGICSVAGQPRQGHDRRWCRKNRGIWEEVATWGYVDQRGQRVIPARFWAVGPFSEGLARVAEVIPEEEGGGARFGYIDRTGEMVLRVSADSTAPYQHLSGKARRWPVHDFSEARAAVRSGGRWGYIDRSGAWAIEPQFAEVGRFSSGRSWVRFASGDAKVDELLEAGASMGLASGPNVGFVGLDGEVLVEPRFTRAEDYENGLSRVEVGFGEWGYIDHGGRFVVTPVRVGSRP